MAFSWYRFLLLPLQTLVLLHLRRLMLMLMLLLCQVFPTPFS